MSLATLNSIAEVANLSQTLLLSIDEDGLVAGDFGKLLWAGSRLVIDCHAGGCHLRISGAGGAECGFFLDAVVLGGPEGVRRFAAWLERGATRAGSSVYRESVAA